MDTYKIKETIREAVKDGLVAWNDHYNKSVPAWDVVKDELEQIDFDCSFNELSTIIFRYDRELNFKIMHTALDLATEKQGDIEALITNYQKAVALEIGEIIFDEETEKLINCELDSLIEFISDEANERYQKDSSKELSIYILELSLEEEIEPYKEMRILKRAKQHDEKLMYLRAKQHDTEDRQKQKQFYNVLLADLVEAYEEKNGCTILY